MLRALDSSNATLGSSVRDGSQTVLVPHTGYVQEHVDWITAMVETYFGHEGQLVGPSKLLWDKWVVEAPSRPKPL